MNLSEENRKTLLAHLHNSIEETANAITNDINNGRINELIDYPPNGGLTEEEKESLKSLRDNGPLKMP